MQTMLYTQMLADPVFISHDMISTRLYHNQDQSFVKSMHHFDPPDTIFRSVSTYLYFMVQ